MNDEDVATLVHRQAEGVRWAVHQLGKAVLLGSVIGLVVSLFFGALGLACAGLIAGWYLVSSSLPRMPEEPQLPAEARGERPQY
jgi:hypothetical protein